MIHKKILKVKTVGSRQQGNLRPEICDSLEKGFNYAVLEYAPDDSWAIIKLWCSDHPHMKDDERKGQVELDGYCGRIPVEETLASHPNDVKVHIARSVALEGEPEIEVNELTNTLTIKGKVGNFIRKINHEAEGKPENLFILDEG